MSVTLKPPCDDVAILQGAAAAPCGASAKRWVLVASILGSSMAIIDGTVVNVRSEEHTSELQSL